MEGDTNQPNHHIGQTVCTDKDDGCVTELDTYRSCKESVSSCTERVGEEEKQIEEEEENKMSEEEEEEDENARACFLYGTEALYLNVRRVGDSELMRSRLKEATVYSKIRTYTERQTMMGKLLVDMMSGQKDTDATH